MANITSDLVFVSDAESTSGWTGDSFVLENQIHVQGLNSVAVIQTGNGANTVTYSGTWNMAGKQLRMYMSSNIMPNTVVKASNGIEIVLSDGSNTARWTVGGSDTYSGGWVDWSIDVDSTPTSGTVNTSAITSVSLTINTSSKPRNSTNGWYDNWRYGNGLTINSSASETINFKNVADADVLTANAWDIIQDTNGVLFARGSLTLGSTGSLNCNLVSSGETLYFRDDIVSSTLYNIASQIGSGTTDINISGMTCKTVGTSAAEIDFSTAITSLSVTGSSFTGMGNIAFYSGATVDSNVFTSCSSFTVPNTITNCTFKTSGLITLTGNLTSCVISKTSATSAVSAVTLNNITGCNFTGDGSSHAVDLGTVSSTTSMGWDNSFSGYAVSDGSTGNEVITVNVASGQTLTINSSNGTPSVNNTGSGTVNVVSGQVTFTLTVKDTSGAVIPNVMVYIEADSGGGLSQGTPIINKVLTDANGQVSDTRSLGSNQPIIGRARKATSSPFYKTSTIIGTIDSNAGLNLTIQMISD